MRLIKAVLLVEITDIDQYESPKTLVNFTKLLCETEIVHLTFIFKQLF